MTTGNSGERKKGRVPRAHVILFGRIPHPGRGKTRLAAGIGRHDAWRFQRRTLQRLLHRLLHRWRSPDTATRQWQLWLALSPDHEPPDPSWPGGWQRLFQKRGDLGTRMHTVFRQLPPGPAVLVGTDIPDIKATHITGAFAALKQTDLVFGPAADGGYWLIGDRRRHPQRHLFDAVRWSTPHALDDTLANVRPGVQVAFLDVLHDIDDPTDYRRWRKPVS